MTFSIRLVCGLSGICLLVPVSHALQSGQDADELLVNYPASFFGRYRLATALDMVRQVPGFQLDDGDSDLGFVAGLLPGE